jgi:hypothetical protein
VVTGATNTGGFIGIHSTLSTLLNGNYWDAENSGFAEGIGDSTSDDDVTGLQTGEMTGDEAEVNMTDFNWVDIWIPSAANYPVLRWQTVE